MEPPNGKSYYFPTRADVGDGQRSGAPKPFAQDWSINLKNVAEYAHLRLSTKQLEHLASAAIPETDEKVGHHGGHSATPREFAEEIAPSDFTGMISVTSVSEWKGIPRLPLLEAMKKRAAVLVRSDKLNGQLPKRFHASGTDFVDTCIDVT